MDFAESTGNWPAATIPVDLSRVSVAELIAELKKRGYRVETLLPSARVEPAEIHPGRRDELNSH